MARKQRKSRNLRAGIAATAARMLADGTAGDFEAAKRKAARELGQESTRNLPDNLEVHNALADYLGLFGGADHAERLRELRLAARDAMATLEEFRPRLAGPVLYGTAGAHAAIDLHVFATEVEAVSRFFLQRGIDFTLVDAPFRFRRDAPPERVSVFKVSFQGERLEIAVFPAETAGRTPLSPIDGRAMQRLTRRGLEELLESPDPISSFDAAGRDPVS